MARFTKELRQEIVREFAVRHNGHFNPVLFLDEVRRRGDEHPAYEWFEWDQEKAAQQYQVEQARQFARDLRVSFSIEQVGRRENVKVRQVEMPMVISPVAGRKSGGGYYLVDTEDPVHMSEHCRQAMVALRSWFDRYHACVAHVGVELQGIEDLMKRLDDASAQRAPHKAA